MNSQDRDQLEAITEALAKLVRRQNETDERLRRIERVLDLAGELPKPAPAPPPVLPPAPGPAPLPPPPPEPAPATAPASQPRLHVETRVGLTWINRIGTATLVLGAAFFFKYAVDNQWIGALGRVVLGVVAGLAVLFLADRLWRNGQQVYAQGICAVGVGIIYLAFYASFGFYHLVPQGVAFLLMFVATLSTAALSLRYDSWAIAVLGFLGAYLTPVLLSTGEDHPWFFLSYVFLLSAAALALARFRNWRILSALGFAATVILFTGWWNEHFDPEKRLVATVFTFAYYALFVSRPILLLSGFAQILSGIALFGAWHPPGIGFLALLLLLTVAGLAIAAWRGWTTFPLFVFVSFWLPYSAWHMAWGPDRPAGLILGLLTVQFLLCLAWLPLRIIRWKSPLAPAMLVLTVFNAGAYFGWGYGLLVGECEAYRGLFAAALAGIHFGTGFVLWNKLPEDRRDARPALLLNGVALTFLTLAMPIQFSAYGITIAWALEAAALAWIASRTARVRLSFVSIVVFLLVLSRLITIDASMYSTSSPYTLLANPRFLTFLVSAASLWATAWWSSKRWLALGPYVAGHFVMLFGLFLEAIGWVNRNIGYEHRSSAGNMSISVLMGFYALLLVFAGVVYRSFLNRLLGLGLVALVILKLYLHDVWQLDRIYRIVAFVALGTLLLVTSYLYSRQRVRIESWWNRDKTRD